jgi:hypothetical protein
MPILVSFGYMSQKESEHHRVLGDVVHIFYATEQVRNPNRIFFVDSGSVRATVIVTIEVSQCRGQEIHQKWNPVEDNEEVHETTRKRTTEKERIDHLKSVLGMHSTATESVTKMSK